MKHWLLAIALICLGGTAKASWNGRLDLAPTVQPLVLREINDGQWLAGTAHYVYGVYHNDNLLFHAGLFHAVNTENGNSSFGPLIGADLMGVSKEIGLDIPLFVGSIGEWVGLPSVFKPAVLFSQMLSVDAFFGYRPIHTADVNGEKVYGLGAALKIPFGVKELEKGL